MRESRMKSRFAAAGVAAILWFGFPDFATATTTLVTPMLERHATSAFRCMVVNIGKKPASFTVELRNDIGDLITQKNVTDLVPGNADITASSGANVFAYCKVTGGFPKKALRISFCLVSAASFDCLGTVVAY